MSIAKAETLVAAARQSALNPVEIRDLDKMPRLCVWEAKAETTLSGEQVRKTAEHIRDGGGLLLSLGKNPGYLPMRLSLMLPTTGWQASAVGNQRAGTTLADFDASFFDGTKVGGLTLPFYYEVRPFHAVERGQSRYDRFRRPAPYVAYSTPAARTEMLDAGENWWSRPLLNHDWRIRAQGDDLARSPLLITGRYGAGRVAVFASSLETLPDDPAAVAFLAKTLAWLSETPPKRSPQVAPPAVRIEPDVAGHAIVVKIRASSPGKMLAVARLMTWEPALIGDLEQTVEPAPNAWQTIRFPIDRIGATSYQALAAKDVLHVRLGLLSEDGRQLLAESAADVDLRPAVQLAVDTPEIRKVAPAFEVPEPEQQKRLGLPVHSYAFRAGDSIDAEIVLTNGVRNLAPLATVADETKPDNASVRALGRESVLAEGKPDWYATDAWGFYDGLPGKENVVSFTFAAPVTLASVTVVGAGDNYRNYLAFNPRSVVVEIDGKEIAREDRLADRFVAEAGLVRLEFKPTKATKVRLRLRASDRGLRLGNVYLEGSLDKLPAAVHGKLTVALIDALGDEKQLITTRQVVLAPLSRTVVPVKITLPQSKAAQFYRIDATLSEGSQINAQAEAPLLTLASPQPLISLASLKPNSAPSLGFIVTRGFRNVFSIGTGVHEMGGGWSGNDDLIWAYERGLKEVGRPITQPGKLYASESDMRHYSTPWRQFHDGEEFYDVAAPLIVERMKMDRRWKTSNLAILDHSDRWDTGPDLRVEQSWQDIVGFDQWLRVKDKPGLKGLTRAELLKDIHDNYEGPWNAWHLQRYVHDIKTLRDAFAKEGKQLLLTAQGAPLVPGKAGSVIGETVRGMSDDCSWGMLEESPPLTVGRQLAALMFSPDLKFSTLLQWGYDSATLNNPQWRGAVGTTEPSRRQYYERAFRGVLRRDGRYASMHTYGFNHNAGLSLVMNEPDYNDFFQVQQRHELLTPDGPIGVGLVLSTAHLESPENVRFTCGDAMALPECRLGARMLRRLHGAGVSVSFGANADCLEQWQGTAPLIVLNINDFSAAQLDVLQRLASRGVKIVAFATQPPLGPAVAARGNFMFIACSPDELTAESARLLQPILNDFCHLPLHFPAGTSGYGFTSNGRSFAVVEDWSEQGRTAPLEIRAAPGASELHAVNVNDHHALESHLQAGWWTVEVPLRPGDGVLVAWEEK